MRNNKAFVMVVQSDAKHNSGELFYKICRCAQYDGFLWNILNPEEYPFHWGFKDIKHALAVANAFNDSEYDGYDEDSSSADYRAMAKRFADLECNIG